MSLSMDYIPALGFAARVFRGAGVQIDGLQPRWYSYVWGLSHTHTCGLEGFVDVSDTHLGYCPEDSCATRCEDSSVRFLHVAAPDYNDAWICPTCGEDSVRYYAWESTPEIDRPDGDARYSRPICGMLACPSFGQEVLHAS